MWVFPPWMEELCSTCGQTLTWCKSQPFDKQTAVRGEASILHRFSVQWVCKISVICAARKMEQEKRLTGAERIWWFIVPRAQRGSCAHSALTCPECQILQAFRCSYWLFYNTAGWNPILEVPEYAWLTVILRVPSLGPHFFALMSLEAGSGQICSRVRMKPSLPWLFASRVQIETLQELQCGFRKFQGGGSETSKCNLPFPSPPHSHFPLCS